MKEDNSLIIRSDNAEHHPNIKTFPFHIHLGKQENLQESPEVTLYDVLSYIKGVITS
jgi:hypothetical protein